MRRWDTATGEPVGRPVHNLWVSLGKWGGGLLGLRTEPATGGQGSRVRLVDLILGKPLGSKLALETWGATNDWGQLVQSRYYVNSLDRTAALAWEGSSAHLWQLTPLVGEPSQVTLQAQVLSRHELDADEETVRKLDEQTWEQRRQRLVEALTASGAGDHQLSAAGDRLHWARAEAAELEATGEWDAAMPYLDRLIAAEPTWPHYARRGKAHVNLGEYTQAVADWKKTQELGGQVWGESVEQCYEAAMVHLAGNDLQGFRRIGQAALERYRASTDYNVQWWLAHLGKLDPEGGPVVMEPVAWLKRKYPTYAYHGLAGAANYRAGQYEAAMADLENGLRALGAEQAQPADRQRHVGHEPSLDEGSLRLFLAMAQHRLGKTAEAQESLKKAQDWIAKAEEGKKQRRYAPTQFDWRDRLEWRLLRQEAEALIHARK